MWWVAERSLLALQCGRSTQTHSSVFTVHVKACTCPQTNLPDIEKYSVVLGKKKCHACATASPCPCYIIGLLMAGIIIGPVYASLKIWFRVPTVCGIYVSEENRRRVWITSRFCDSPEPMWQRGRARRKDSDLSIKGAGGSVWECVEQRATERVAVGVWRQRR